MTPQSCTIAVKKKRKVRRPAIVLVNEDVGALERALASLAAQGDMASLRPRAFILLRWDGAGGLKAAVALNAEEVVKDPAARRITVRRQVSQRPCEENRYRAHTFPISRRTQAALSEYLAVVRAEGWLADGRLEGPLFLSSHFHGEGRRLTRRAAFAAWDTFQREYFNERTRDYKMGDLVLTGRRSFLRAGGSTRALALYAAISWRSAETYYAPTNDEPSALEILDRVSSS